MLLIFIYVLYYVWFKSHYHLLLYTYFIKINNIYNSCCTVYLVRNPKCTLKKHKGNEQQNYRATLCLPIGVLNPFSYSEWIRRLNEVREAPHIECCKLLQVPSSDRYFE